LSIYAKNIDYNTIVETAMPYLANWLSEQDNFFYEILKKMISKKGKPTAFSKILVTLMPKKSEMAAAILPHFDDVLIEYLNNNLIKKYASARISSLKMDTVERRNDTMLRIEIKVEDIDYEKSASALFPLLLSKLSDKDEKTQKIAHLIEGLGELPNQVILAALGAIPVQQRDELAVKILSEFDLELVTTINSIIEGYHMKANVTNIKVDSI
jgi:hypothetical protein